MNIGTSSKNLTDGLLVAMAFFALIGLIVGFVKFEGPYLTTDPRNDDEITVEKPLDDPYVKTFLFLFLSFAFVAAAGLALRKIPIIPSLLSIGLIVVSLYCFSYELVEKNGFAYVLCAVFSLAGNLIYTYFHYKDKMEAKKEQSKVKKSKSK